MRYSLRATTTSDWDDIADIWHSSASLPGVGPVSMPSRDELRSRLDPEFAAGWFVMLAVCEGTTVGFVAMKRSEAVLAELFVRPDAVGNGIGRKLLEEAQAEMPTGFTLFTRTANVRARRFYEDNGLRAIKEGFHPRSGDPVVYYRWESGFS